MTDNEYSDYMWNLMNDLASMQYKFKVIHERIITIREDLKDVKQALLLRIRLFELWKSFNKYTHTSLNAKIMFKPDELYQEELLMILSAALDDFEHRRQ